MTDYSLNEVWAPVPGYEGYYSASTLGRVRSESRHVVRTGGQLLALKSRILKPDMLRNGYHQVTLSMHAARAKNLVHRLVLLAFCGDAQGMMGCHNNGIPSDNRLVNLRWDTQIGNVADKKLHGTYAIGDSHQCSKVTSAEVELIVIDTRSNAEIANEYGISKSYVRSLKLNNGRIAIKPDGIGTNKQT